MARRRILSELSISHFKETDPRIHEEDLSLDEKQVTRDRIVGLTKFFFHIIWSFDSCFSRFGCVSRPIYLFPRFLGCFCIRLVCIVSVPQSNNCCEFQGAERAESKPPTIKTTITQRKI